MITHRRTLADVNSSTCGLSFEDLWHLNHVFAAEDAPPTCLWCVAGRNYRSLLRYDLSFTYTVSFDSEAP
jgi:hypothetical protein